MPAILHSEGFLAVQTLRLYGEVTVSKPECIWHIEKKMGAELRKRKKTKASSFLSGNTYLVGDFLVVSSLESTKTIVVK